MPSWLRIEAIPPQSETIAALPVGYAYYFCDKRIIDTESVTHIKLSAVPVSHTMILVHESQSSSIRHTISKPAQERILIPNDLWIKVNEDAEQ